MESGDAQGLFLPGEPVPFQAFAALDPVLLQRFGLVQT